MTLANPVQGKGMPEIPKHQSGAKTGSKAIPKIALSGESARVDVHGASMEAIKFETMARQAQRPGSRGRSRPHSAVGEVMVVNPLTSLDVLGTSNAQSQQGQKPYRRSRSRGRNLHKLSRNDSTATGTNTRDEMVAKSPSSDPIQ